MRGSCLTEGQTDEVDPVAGCTSIATDKRSRRGTPHPPHCDRHLPLKGKAIRAMTTFTVKGKAIRTMNTFTLKGKAIEAMNTYP